ncbi:UbiA family prenyltransferase [soil metagenome]
MAIKPYLQLVRLPNVFTAAADSLAGWLLVAGTFAEPGRWLPLVLASMAIYAAGIALNDYFDIEVDRQERPGRPLPSEQVSRGFALGLALALFVLGLTLAASSGSNRSLGIAVLLVVCVVGYDAGLRRTVLGPQVMGACRGLNVLLGMSQVPEFGGPPAWLVAGSMALFIIGVTWISRSEATGGGRAVPSAGMALQNAAIFGLLIASLRHETFPDSGIDREIVPIGGLLILLLVALLVNLATGKSVREPTPSTLQTAVKTGILSLVWLHVGVLVAVRGPGPALAVAALWVPTFLLGRWLYST